MPSLILIGFALLGLKLMISPKLALMWQLVRTSVGIEYSLYTKLHLIINEFTGDICGHIVDKDE